MPSEDESFEVDEEDLFALPEDTPDFLRAEHDYLQEKITGEERAMAATVSSVPDAAVPIAGPAEAPQGTQVIEGPRGGTYYVPEGTEGVPDEGGEGPPGGEPESHHPDPPTDVPRFRDNAALVERVEEFNERDEWGFTLNADLTNYEGGGWIVTLNSRVMTKADHVSAPEVIDFYREAMPVLQLAPERAKLGGWSAEEGDDYKSLDLNVVLPAEQREFAVMLGERFNQQGIFNADTGEYVPTGGSGDPPVETMDETADLLEEVIGESELRMRLQHDEPSMGVEGPMFGESAPTTMYADDEGREVSGRRIFMRLRTGRYELIDYTDDGVIAVHDAETGDDVILHPVDSSGAALAEGDEGPFSRPPPGGWTAEERAFHDVFEGTVWSDDTETRMLEFTTGEIPDAVRDRLIQAIRDEAIWYAFDRLTQSDRDRIVNAMTDALADEGAGWSTMELASQIEGAVPTLDRDRAFMIARTEMAAVTNEARRSYYEDAGMLETARFRWTGPQDHRTTDACEWLKYQTKDGVPYSNPDATSVEDMGLIELQEEASSRWFPSLEFREHVVHPFERHTYVRHYDINRDPADVPDEPPEPPAS